MCACSVTKSCPTLCDLMGCSPPGSSVHEISQTRILERVAISFSRGSPHVSYIAGRFSAWVAHLTWNLWKDQILPLVVYSILYPYERDLYTKEKEALFYSYLSIPVFYTFHKLPSTEHKSEIESDAQSLASSGRDFCLPPSFPCHPLFSIICKKQEKGQIGCLSFNIVSSVQFSSVAQSCPTLWTPWIAARQASLSITNSRSSLRLMSIESEMPSSHLILWSPG